MRDGCHRRPHLANVWTENTPLHFALGWECRIFSDKDLSATPTWITAARLFRKKRGVFTIRFMLIRIQQMKQTSTKPLSNRFKEIDMNADQILMEIRETNLSYLMLAQSLIRADREQALFRLGISEDTATTLAMLSPAQIMKIASSNTLLCRMRIDDDMVWNLLTNHGKAGSDNVTRLHANILMAGRHQEAA